LISQTAEYALRAALYLAARPSDRPASASEIAEATQVPVRYLQRVLRMLARHELLTAQRGTGGGFALAKVPSAISVLDVLHASDMQIPRIQRCPLGIPGHRRLCALHRMLDAEMARSEQTFSATTLADLLDGSGDNRPMCDAAAAPPGVRNLRVSAAAPRPTNR
jgi:Rrf2 family protein